MFRTSQPPFLLCFALLLCTACSGPPKAPEIDNALLANASADEMQRIAEARSVHDEAEDAYAGAKQVRKDSENREKLARATLKTRRAKLEQTQLSAVIAESGGTAAQVEIAEREHSFSIANAELARQELSHAKRELEWAKLEEKRALEDARLASARVELEKASAVADVDRADARRVAIEDYRKQVEYHTKELATARKRAEAARSRSDEARLEVDKARIELEQLRPQALQERAP